MKQTIYALSLTVLAVVAIALIFNPTATAESGWPINDAGEPLNGGNWQGSGQLDIPPEGIQADWYNDTNGGDIAWTIESGEDITRSYSAFDRLYDITIQDGGILRLDSILFVMNNTNGDHQITVEDGGKLYVTNSTLTIFEITLFSGSELYILPGNNSNYISIYSADSAGIIVPSGATFQMRGSTLTGSTTLLTIEDPDAVIEENMFTTFADGAACIHLKASATVNGSTFDEGASTGSMAILADSGVTSKIYENEFRSFRHGGSNLMGRAVVSHGPIELYDNIFRRMIADNAQSDPYVVYFIGSEPTNHNSDPVWETNRFMGKTNNPNDERVNIFKQAWNVDITVNNMNSGNPIVDVEVTIENKDDDVVGTLMTDAAGHASFEVAEFYVSALDDGKEGDSVKNSQDQNPFDISATKDAETANLEDQTINMDKQFDLELDLLEFDFGVSTLEPTDPAINAGDTITLDATVFNNGYDRATSVTVEYYINDGTRAETKLGEEEILVDKDSVHAYLDVLIGFGYANTDVTFMAITLFGGDADGANDGFTTGSFHINEKPTVAITAPATGQTFSGPVTVTGTAADDVSVSVVQMNITGEMDWTDVTGTDTWEYEFDSTVIGLTNGEYTLNVRSMDSNGAYSDVASITFNILNKPKVAITAPVDGSLLVGNTTYTMVGSAQKLDTDIQMITITIDGTIVINATKVANDWSQWSFPLMTIPEDNINSLSDGVHTFTATVTDGADLTSTFTVTYTIYSMDESTKPVVNITTEFFDLTTDTWVEGSATDDFKVTGVEFRVNDGVWSTATEALNLDTVSATWRIRLTPNNADLVPGFTNLIYVKAFDDDGNTTATLQFNVLAEGLVDLKIDSASIILQNAAGTELKAADLKVDKLVKIFVPILVEGNAGNLEQVKVSLSIGGVPAGDYEATNTSVGFTAEFSVLLKETMKDTKAFSIRVDPSNQIEENNDANDGSAETNNEYSGELPGSVQKAVGTDSGGSDGIIPGFETAFMVVAMLIGGVIALIRKRD